MKPTWHFPLSDGGQLYGLNNAGIAIFSGDAIRSMTRETIQNSIDARASAAAPVEVTFSLLNVRRELIPCGEVLQNHIAKARDYTRASYATNPAGFEENGRYIYEHALRLAEQPTVPVLRCGDSNTTGLVGDDGHANSPWDRLIRQQGSPGMHGVGGGSYGVGQLAPFAASRLRTVFYSSRTADGKFKFIGKSIWRSVQSGDDWYQHIGFCGLPQKKGVGPITDNDAVPREFQRAIAGTDLFIVGFDPHTSAPGEVPLNWRSALTDAVLKNFFAAITRNQLRVRIEEPDAQVNICIDAKSIKAIVDQRIADASSAAKTARDRDEVNRNLVSVRVYVKALQGGEHTRSFEKKLPRLGRTQLLVARDEDGPCRVAHARAPLMLVHERSFSVLSKYGAVLLCEDSTGNEVLRSYEGPEHDSWLRKVPGRETVVRDLNAFIREALETLAGDQAATEQDVEGLAEYLPEDLPASGLASGGVKVSQRREDKESGKREPRRGKARVRIQRLRDRALPQTRTVENDAGVGEGLDGAGGAGEFGDGGEGETSGGPAPGTGRGDRGDAGDTLPKLRDSELTFRSWFVSEEEGCAIHLASGRTGCAHALIRAVGEDSVYPLSVTSLTDAASGEPVRRDEEGRFLINLTGGARRLLKLLTSPPRRLSLTIEVE